MPARSAKQNVTKLTPTASTPQGELQKHLRTLALDSVAAYRVWCREQGFGSALDKPWQERRRESRQAQKLAEGARTDSTLGQHILDLHFEDHEEYAVWCERNGLLQTGLKTAPQRKQEAALREQQRAAEAFQKGRRQVRKPAEALEELYHDRLPKSELHSPALQAIHAAFSTLRKDVLASRAFLRLLLAAQQHTGLIASGPVLSSRGAQEDEEFWTSVLHFFVNNPMLDPEQIGPIVDFLHNRRFERQPIVGPDGVPTDAAPEPTFSMKGRTVPALLRRIEEWHRELHRERRKAVLEWEPRPDIAPLDYTQCDHEEKPILHWTVRELTNGRELQEEGKEMRHCVASYDDSCVRGSRSIWSLQVRTCVEERSRRVMTIEVHNQRRAIVQARGRCNKTATARQAGFWLKHAPVILKMWAAREKITVATHL